MSPFAVLPAPPVPTVGAHHDSSADSSAPPRRLGDLLAAPHRRRGPLVRPADVGGRAAWDVLVRDGALEVVRGDAAVVAGTAVSPVWRAALLGGSLPAGAVVAGRTAAWVHAGPAAGPRADHLDVAYPAGGHRPELWGTGLVWQAPLLHGDTVELAGVRVTAPLRTVVDVAVHVPGDEDAAVLARALADACGLALTDAAALLERRARVVGRPRARDVLARAAALRAAPAALP